VILSIEQTHSAPGLADELYGSFFQLSASHRSGMVCSIRQITDVRFYKQYFDAAFYTPNGNWKYTVSGYEGSKLDKE